MLAELRSLLGACPAGSRRSDYRAAVVDDNVLLRATATTRRKTFVVLGQLYGLDPSVLLFRALRELWEADAGAQPLLAALCALARDPTFRATAGPVVEAPAGAPVTPQQLADAVRLTFPDRFSAHSLKAIGQHAASSWQQAGHLHGRLAKVRARAACRPAAVVYALLLGQLTGARGDALFDTSWCRVLDAPAHELRSQAATASQQGWLEYRHSGGVTDVTFRHLLGAGQGGPA